jgi:predicted NAD/FAD-binding protein
MGELSRQRIAVVGAGIAGVVSAFLLQQDHDVTLYERNETLEGHAGTIVIPPGPDEGLAVDPGFVVLNRRTSPLFERFLRRMNVPLERTDISFSCHDRKSGLVYSGRNLFTLFADPWNLFRPSFWGLLRRIMRFNGTTRKRLLDGNLAGLSLGEYVEREKIENALVGFYLIPMAAAIWPGAGAGVLAFPAEVFARFYENQGLLSSSDPPQWVLVKGGRPSLVRSFRNGFQGEIRLTDPITSVGRTRQGAWVETESGKREDFDRIVLATHADEALRLLAEPLPEESRLLTPWQYTRTRAVLHTDASFLPPRRRAWASWNYLLDGEEKEHSPVTVTYHLNPLEHLKAAREYFVTVNPSQTIPREKILAETVYRRPLFTFDSLATQKRLPFLNGNGSIFFCGSYFGYGFHEDAVRSAVDVGRHFGMKL